MGDRDVEKSDVDRERVVRTPGNRDTGGQSQRGRQSKWQKNTCREMWKSSHKGQRCREAETPTDLWGRKRYQRYGNTENLGGNVGLRRGQRTMTKNKEIQGNRTEA